MTERFRRCLRAACSPEALIPALLGAVAALIVQRDGVLFDPDSVAYFDAARQIRAHPLHYLDAARVSAALPAHFPPLYPLVLAIAGPGMSIQHTAVLVNVVLAAATLATVSRLVSRHSSPAVGILTAVALLCSRGFLLALHGFLMSDSLHLFLAVATMSVLDRRLRLASEVATEPGTATALISPWRLAIAPAALAALGVSTRLAGIGLVMAVGLSFAVLAPRAARLRAAAIALVVGMTPLALWLALEAGGGRAGDRPLSWFPTEWSEAGELLRTIGLFGTPAAVMRSWLRFMVMGIVAVGLVVMALRSIRQIRGASDPTAPGTERTVAVLGIHIWMNSAVLLASRLFAEPYLGFAPRHFLAIWASLLMIGAIRMAPLFRRLGSDRTRSPIALAVGISLALVLLGSAAVTVHSMIDPHRSWFNLESEATGSAMLRRIERAPDGVIIYTNRPDLVVLVAGRDARPLPTPTYPESGTPDPSYAVRRREMSDAASADHSIVAVFDSAARWAPPLEEITAATGLRHRERFADGALRTRDP